MNTNDALEFEKRIGHNMRFKEWWDENETLYWITQEYYTQEDLEQFKREIRKENKYKKAVITCRSNYDHTKDDVIEL